MILLHLRINNIHIIELQQFTFVKVNPNRSAILSDTFFRCIFAIPKKI